MDTPVDAAAKRPVSTPLAAAIPLNGSLSRLSFGLGEVAAHLLELLAALRCGRRPERDRQSAGDQQGGREKDPSHSAGVDRSRGRDVDLEL